MTQMTLRCGHTYNENIVQWVHRKIGKRVKTVQHWHIAIEMVEESAVSGIKQCCHQHKKQQYEVSSIVAVKA